MGCGPSNEGYTEAQETQDETVVPRRIQPYLSKFLPREESEPLRELKRRKAHEAGLAALAPVLVIENEFQLDSRNATSSARGVDFSTRPQIDFIEPQALRPINGVFPVFDQNPLNSCATSAIRNCAVFMGLSPISVPMLTYLFERAFDDGEIGANVAMVARNLHKIRLYPESIWKYEDFIKFYKKHENLKVAELPDDVKREMKGGDLPFRLQGKIIFEKGQSRKKVQDVCEHLIHTGTPVVVGVQFVKSAWSPNGQVSNSQGKRAGAHAILIYGYDEKNLLFVNSWGADWGDGGRGRMAKPYFESYGVKAVSFERLQEEK